MTYVDIATAEECLKFSILHSDQIKLPIAIWGYHGIGKTELVKKIAKDLNMNLVILHLSTQDITDLIGIPRDKEVIIQDKKEKITIWSCPVWLFEALEQSKITGKRNLFFLDEMNRASRVVLNAMLPFLIEGKIHTHSINTHDVVIAAMNPSDENYDTQEIFDKALLDRMGHIILSPSLKDYIQYMKEKNIDDVTLQIIEENPHFVEIPKINLNFEVTPSRRKIEYVMRKFVKMPRDWILKYGKSVLSCYLGESFARLWIKKIQYLNSNEITLEKLKNYQKNKTELENLLQEEIEGVKVLNEENYKICINIITNYLSDFYTKENQEDINWIFDFLSFNLISKDKIKSFLNNETVKSKIIINKDFNKKIGNFLKEKNILTTVNDLYNIEKELWRTPV